MWLTWGNVCWYEKVWREEGLAGVEAQHPGFFTQALLKPHDPVGWNETRKKELPFSGHAVPEAVGCNH